MNKQADIKDGWQWAVVEIFSHRKHAGRTREEERFGAKMLRIDVPIEGNPDEKGWQTIYYGGSSIFSFGLTDEASVMKANRPYAPPALTRWRAPEDRLADLVDDEDGSS